MQQCSKVLCCAELPQGNPSVGRFSLQEFNIWYLMLKCLSVLNIFVVYWLASPTSVSAGHNLFAGGENINLVFVLCSGPSVRKQ